MKRTAIILGTSRSDGNTALLANEIKERTDATLFDISQYNISAYDYEYKNKDDDYKELVKEVLTYDNLVFASPVYWYSPSVQMKLFLDRISDLLVHDKPLARKFAQKTASLLSTGVDIDVKACFEESFINSFKYLNMPYTGMLYIPCGFDENVDNAGANIELKKYEKQIIEFTKNYKKD